MKTATGNLFGTETTQGCCPDQARDWLPGPGLLVRAQPYRTPLQVLGDRFLKAVAIAVLISLAACANDTQRTETGGTLIGVGVGTAVGAALGAGVAAVTGGNVAKGAAIGAGAGAVLGGVAGYQWGQSVVRKKAQYARSEDYLKACIADARGATRAAQRENQALRRSIASYQQQTRQLTASYRQGQADRRDLIKASNALSRQQQDVQRKIQYTGNQIAISRQELAQARSDPSTPPQQIQQMNAEIEALSAQKRELQAHNEELSNLSERLGV